MNPIPNPILCYVTDRAGIKVTGDTTRESAVLDHIRVAAAAGVGWIELREKDLEGGPLAKLARSAAEAIASAATNGKQARLLINDRLDVALAAGASGVHLPETALPVSAVVQWKRQVQRTDFLVGVSCHSKEGAERAAGEGADYVFFGPVFGTASKAAFGPPQGLEKLSAVCRAVAIPVVAIGGIRAENAHHCFATGARGIAAIGLFQSASASELDEIVGRLRRAAGG